MSSPVEKNNNTGAGDLSDKVAAQGDLVRKLKGEKKPKEEITAAVEVLLALKVSVGQIFSCLANLMSTSQAEFKTKTGNDWQPAGGAPAKQEKQKKAAKEVKPKEKVESD